MTLREMLRLLAERTPDLLVGFANNLRIAALAMALGTAIGWMLGVGRDRPGRGMRLPSTLMTSVCRNIPSFVLMFYLAFVLPVEVTWGDQVFAVPLWLKATLALTIPVIGFASDQGLAYRRQRRRGMTDAGAIFMVAWVQYYLILLMGSATASVIGADEVVGRVNQIIAYESTPAMMLLGYTYVSLFFFAASLIITALARWIRTHRESSAPAR